MRPYFLKERRSHFKVTGILTETPTCDIANGWVSYSGSKLTKCGGENSLSMTTSSIVVTGTSTESKGIYVSLTSETLDITFDTLKLAGRLPLKVDGSGTLNIILKGDNTLKSKDQGTDNDNSNNGNLNPTIFCNSKSANIVIKAVDSNAKLTVKASKANPAIGTLTECNSIKIEGGIIVATGGTDKYKRDSSFTIDHGSGAGIGTGTVGTITTIEISGGHITATGGQYAAGIGTGTESKVGTIKITGGTVISSGSGNGAGIGAGDSGIIETEISITGGTIQATGVYRGSAIGAGNGGIEGYGYVKKISISGTADVTATCGANVQAAAIGAGFGETQNSAYVDTISITGGKVTAILDGSVDAAAIGGGRGQQRNSAYVNTIEITGGTIAALGSYNAAGIGIGMSVFNVKEDNTASNIHTKFKITTDNLKFCAASRHEQNSLGTNSKNGQYYDNVLELSDQIITKKVYNPTGTYFLSLYPDTTEYCVADIQATPAPGQTEIPEPTDPPQPEETETPTPEPEVTETPKPEPEPVVTETQKPEPVPVVTETPKPEPVETETSTPEPEPVVTETQKPEPEPEVTEKPNPQPEPEASKEAEQTPAPEDENAQKNHNEEEATSGSSNKKDIPWAIIGIAAGALVLAALLSALIIKLKKREKMNVERTNTISNDSSAVITQDNPLYKDGNESDDPFKNDFEENVGSVVNQSATQI